MARRLRSPNLAFATTCLVFSIAGQSIAAPAETEVTVNGNKLLDQIKPIVGNLKGSANTLMIVVANNSKRHLWGLNYSIFRGKYVDHGMNGEKKGKYVRDKTRLEPGESWILVVKPKTRGSHGAVTWRGKGDTGQQVVYAAAAMGEVNYLHRGKVGISLSPKEAAEKVRKEKPKHRTNDGQTELKLDHFKVHHWITEGDKNTPATCVIQVFDRKK